MTENTRGEEEKNQFRSGKHCDDWGLDVTRIWWSCFMGFWYLPESMICVAAFAILFARFSEVNRGGFAMSLYVFGLWLLASLRNEYLSGH
jgi:hypothetical protein